jgi:hypothetical protein
MKLPIRALTLFTVAVLGIAGCEIHHRSGRGEPPVGPSYPCQRHGDCAEGCYCGGGTCQEAGFCTDPEDCGSSYRCNADRSSCEPGCKVDDDCNGDAGERCDVPTGTCTQGSCAGAITCTTVAPKCPTGSVPLIFGGCYTGSCLETAQCTASPVCENVNDEPNCLNRTADCTAVYVGLNCTNMVTGQPCHSGDSGCKCESFQFDRCKTTQAAQ